MKKLKWIIIPLWILLVGCGTVSKEERNRLEEKGYNASEVAIINNKLNTDQINKLLQFEYIEIVGDLLSNKDYNDNNFDKYALYYLSNKGVSAEKDIMLVNNSIDITYTDTVDKIMDEEYFILNNIKRYASYADSHELDAKEIVKRVNSNVDYDFYTNIRNSDTSKEYLVLVNKFYKLDSNYEPDDLVLIDSRYSVWGYLRKDAYDAFIKMVKDAEKEGLYIINTSPYRDYAMQSRLYNGYVESEGKEQADRSSARPGHSEHQTGLALDLKTSLSSMYEFGNTAEGRWTKVNAYKYGFILRYTTDTEYITGYKNEPWHYRYVGVEASKYIYEHNITLEEYYEYFVK